MEVAEVAEVAEVTEVEEDVPVGFGSTTARCGCASDLRACRVPRPHSSSQSSGKRGGQGL